MKETLFFILGFIIGSLTIITITSLIQLNKYKNKIVKEQEKNES